MGAIGRRDFPAGPERRTNRGTEIMNKQFAATAADEGKSKTGSALHPNFLSHGTLICKNLASTRKFYEEFLGLEVVQTSDISLLVRLGGAHTFACVETDKTAVMPFLYHNGLDVGSDSEVDDAHEIACEQAGEWGLHKITRPRAQHGSYSFYFWDKDENCWEILSNPEGGYTWLFEKGDQTGRGHLGKDFERPEVMFE